MNRSLMVNHPIVLAALGRTVFSVDLSLAGLRAALTPSVLGLVEHRRPALEPLFLSRSTASPA